MATIGIPSRLHTLPLAGIIVLTLSLGTTYAQQSYDLTLSANPASLINGATYPRVIGRAFSMDGVEGPDPTASLADDIELRVAQGVNPGDVQLSWTGGVGPFLVYRSPHAAGVVAPANIIGQTGDPYYTDTSDPLVGEAEFYVIVSVCGNGVLDPGEQCDDANTVDGDGCSSICQLEVCGNGVLDPGEQCDDANPSSGDGCSSVCQLEVCGNGVLDFGEQCDDANTVDGDGCSSACQLEVCGNGVLDPGEQCDDANPSSGDGCSSVCQLEVCGNGVLDSGEQCDDANTVDGDGCSSACQLEVCGNGVLDSGEQCDDANTVDGDGCSSACQLEVCGNGVLDSGEQCDDANTVDGDGCSSACQLEVCGNGVLDSGEQCDDGNTADGDGCSSACQLEVCGNGVLDSGEQCDDGNTADGDGCSSTCQNEGTTGLVTVDLSCQQVFFAYQDGDGPWTSLAGTGGVYQFEIHSAKGGYAFVTQDQYASISVNLHTLAELTAGPIVIQCGGNGKTISGTAAGLGTDDSALVGLGGGAPFSNVNAASPAFEIKFVQDGNQDLIAYRRGGNPDRAIIRRDLNLADGDSVGIIDFEGAEAFAPTTAMITVQGGTASETFNESMDYFSGADCLTARLYSNSLDRTSPSFMVSGIPAAQQRASDFHMLSVTANAPTAIRGVHEHFNTLADRTVTLPTALISPTVTSLGGAYKRLQSEFAVPSEYGFATLGYFSVAQPTSSSVIITASSGWIGGSTAVLAMPDFSGLTGWNDGWAPASTATGTWTVAAQGFDPPHPSFSWCLENARSFVSLISGPY